jgi:hypothetical protein
MNAIVIIAVAITEITLAVIDGNLRPSGACRIYPNVIRVHAIAGSNVTI